MNRIAISALVLGTVALVAVACATTYTTQAKTLICKQAIQTLVAPECVRLDQVGQRYVELCQDVVEDAMVACEAGFTDNPILMCEKIGEKANQCALIADGDTSPSEAKLRNIATCERVVRAAGFACTLALVTPVPEPTATPTPAPLPE